MTRPLASTMRGATPRRNVRRLALAAFLIAGLTLPKPGAASTVDEPPVLDASTFDALPVLEVVEQLTAADPAASPAPGGREALERSIVSLSATLGTQRAPTADVRGVPAEVAGRLAETIRALQACALVSAEAAPSVVSANPPAPETASAFLGCALRLRAAAAGLAVALRDAPVLPEVDAWPVLRLEPGMSDDVYLHDYALLVDAGGRDTYANNAGGNLLDVQHGPAGSVALEHGPAQGCQAINPGLHCIVGSALLLDLAGDDVYGVLEAPGLDARCTSDPLVRRIVTQGAGLAGVGMLIDDAGSDTYTAKTLSQGSGHVAGVGLLHDRGDGDDTYVAIRNAQGFSLVEGVGVLADEGGDDTFGSYMPGPANPDADPDPRVEEDGGGGVIDDIGNCDKLPRQLQGTANVGGVGVLLNEGGDDVYEAVPPSQQQFNGAITFAHASQGFGACGAVGALIDTDGLDAYRFVSDDRRDGARLHHVETDCSKQPVAGVGLFVDSGPEPADDLTPPTISLPTPADGGDYRLGEPVPADYTCSDEPGGSGIASCEGSVAPGSAIDTGTVGAKEFAVEARDHAGNAASVLHAYRVIYAFQGFDGPVESPPAINAAKAGSAIPVRFSLGGDQGPDVLAAGSPSSRRVECGTSADLGDVQPTTSTGSGLVYDPGTQRYRYVWKTDRAWAGTCRQLDVELADGTHHLATFRFS